MIKTEAQLIYEQIRHIVSANYVVPKHLDRIELEYILELLKTPTKEVFY